MARAISRILAASAITACAIAAPMSSHAEEPIPPTRVEITLFGGYRFGGAGALEESTQVTVDGETSTRLVDVDLAKGSSYGLALNWEAETDSFYELAYSTQSSALDASIPLDVTLEYLQIGGYMIFGANTQRVVPYFLMTIGAGRITPDDADLRETTKFAAAIGGGAKINITPHIALRIDGRVYATFLGSEDNVFCAGEDGIGCKIHLEGDTIVQPEISLGLTYGF